MALLLLHLLSGTTGAWDIFGMFFDPRSGLGFPNQPGGPVTRLTNAMLDHPIDPVFGPRSGDQQRYTGREFLNGGVHQLLLLVLSESSHISGEEREHILKASEMYWNGSPEHLVVY